LPDLDNFTAPVTVISTSTDTVDFAHSTFDAARDHRNFDAQSRLLDNAEFLFAAIDAELPPKKARSVQLHLITPYWFRTLHKDTSHAKPNHILFFLE